MAAGAAIGKPWLPRLFPFLAWRGQINRETLRADFVAGLTGAIVVLPQGVAFAFIAGMPPEYGLYAGMVPAIVAALWGSSRHLVSGPTTAASVVLFSALSAFAEPGTHEYVRLALTLTFMVGVIELAMGLARLGTLVNFISHSVIVGFTAGAAILIATKQIKNFFGLEIPRGLHFHEILLHFAGSLDEINLYVTAVGAVTLATSILVRRRWPRLPHMLVAMIVGSLVSVALNALIGEKRAGIATVGALPASLPPPSAPVFDWAVVRELAPAALAMTLFALTEAVSIARSIAARAGYQIDGNQEFIGQGLSNIAGSFFSGYVATGSFNRSALNFAAGARTPVAAVLAGVLLMGIVVVVAPLVAYLPNAAMAAILFVVAWGLIDLKHIRHILKASRSDTAVLLTTFLGALFLDLEFAILAGVILSLVLYLMRTSRPRILPRVPDPRLPKRQFNTDPSLPECPQLKMVRIDGSLFFGAVPHVQETLACYERERPEQRHLLLLMQGVNFADVAGAEFLAHEAERRRALGGGLYLYRAKEGVMEVLRRGGYLQTIGEENCFRNKGDAIAAIVQRLDPDVCARCTARIFKECAQRPGAQTRDAAGVDAAQGEAAPASPA